MDDELRKAAQDFADSVDGYENDLPLSAIRAKGALRAALSNNANAAPQDAPKSVDCERCGLTPELHTPTHWCDNQSFQVAAPDPKPVAWMDEFGNTFPFRAKEYSPVGKYWKPLYTAPVATPQQPVSMETVYDTIIEWSTAGKGSRRELARRMIALFAAPQREWQGLTKDEINDCAGAEIYSSSWAMAFARAIEQTLRRKNT